MSQITRFQTVLIWASMMSLACDPSPTDPTDTSDTDATDTEDTEDTEDTQDTDATTDTDDTTGSPTSVTVGAYLLDNGSYVDQDKDLTYNIGASCQIWSRTADHPDREMPGHPTTPHDHWNAADDSSYVDDAFTWTEYGPYLTEDEIADACADGIDPSDPKTVTSDDYTEMQPGLYLKIKSVQ